MQTPPRTVKKRKMSSSHVAPKVQIERGPAKTSKAAKRFEKRVLKVLKEPTATGKYTQTITQWLYQDTYNCYSIFSSDIGNGQGSGASDLEFFTPRQFKDAEAVCFNGKPSTYNSWAFTTEGPNLNFPAQQPCKVNNSSASFRLKNMSNHKAIVEMYVCRGRGGSTSLPHLDWESSINASGKFSVTGITAVNPTITRNIHVHMEGLEPFDSLWKVDKIVWKFEPGEEGFHILKGPRAYMMDGSKKVKPSTIFGSAPTWEGPQQPGSGCYVFFRYLNHVALATSSAGSKIGGQFISVCHPPNDVTTVAEIPDRVGGCVVEITRHYNMEAPMGVTVATANAHIINTNYGGPLGTIVDIQCDEDQPMTNVTNPT